MSERNYHREMADEIERLQAEVARLREALEGARWWFRVVAVESIADLDINRCIAKLDAVLADEPEAIHYWAG